MKKFYCFLLSIVICSLFFLSQTATATGSTLKNRTFLNKKVAKIESVPFKIFWVETKDGASYIVSSNGRFVISSPVLHDVKTGADIHDIDSLKMAMKPDVGRNAVLYLVRKGRPAALVVVDEYCPYCERLIRDIVSLLEAGKRPKYDIAVAFFPVHPRAVKTSCKLMDAGPKKARELYLKWVRTQDPHTWDNMKCSPETQKKFLIMAAELQMSGLKATPTIILPDGTQFLGYRNVEDILFQKVTTSHDLQR